MRPRSSLIRITGLLAFAAAMALGGRARAQLGTGGTGLVGGTGGTGGTTFTTSDFFIGVQADMGVNLTDADLPRFFNKAHCDCDTPVYLFFALEPSGIAKRSTITSASGNVTWWMGPDCSTIEGQAITDCVPLDSETLNTFLSQGNHTITKSARLLSTFVGTTGIGLDGGVTTTTPITANCEPPTTGTNFTQTITMNIDVDGDGIIDFSDSTAFIVDLSPPPAPTGVKAAGGNEAIVVSWTDLDTSVVTDLQAYQILCSRADQYQVFKTGTYGPVFQACTAPSADGGVVNGPIDGGVEDSDPFFACSPQLSPLTGSYRVDILQNDITYAAAVVAIDNSFNASPPVPIVYATPIKTLSFYDVYRNGMMDQTPDSGPNADLPGGASGGYCALGTARPRLVSTLAALGAFALGGLGLTIARRRRRRR